ncbi:lipoprotein [Lentzea sp.]|uniref:lipoprotein n=1 Tax=Lentzea sp. TaxID=56099 RepID=UPI002ED6B6BB
MRRTLIALTAAATLSGCTSEPPATPRGALSSALLADEWDRKLDAATQTPHPCGPTTARTTDCADWLTAQTDVVSALGAALRAREDSRRYSSTLAGVVKVFQSREAFEECGTDEECWRHAQQITAGTQAVRTTLGADESR